MGLDASGSWCWPQGVSRGGRSGFFVRQNLGKRSLFVDVKGPEGRELVEAFVSQVDVLVENFSPGVMSMNGEPGSTPALMGLSPGDVLTDVQGLAGVTAALYHRERTGEGRV